MIVQRMRALSDMIKTFKLLLILKLPIFLFLISCANETSFTPVIPSGGNTANYNSTVIGPIEATGVDQDCDVARESAIDIAVKKKKDSYFYGSKEITNTSQIVNNKTSEDITINKNYIHYSNARIDRWNIVDTQIDDNGYCSVTIEAYLELTSTSKVTLK